MTRATVFDIQRASINDGPGIRTCIFLKGCTLACIWCHNPESHKVKPELAFFSHRCTHCGQCSTIPGCSAHQMINGKHTFDRNSCVACGKCIKLCSNNALKLYGYSMSAQEVYTIVKKDKAYYDSSGGGMTISGGEPLLHAGFCEELFTLCKSEGIHTAMETSGNGPLEVLTKLAPLVDLFLFDIKLPDSDSYKKYTGRSNENVIKNLRCLDTLAKKIVIRAPIIPGINESYDFIDYLRGLRETFKHIIQIELLPYHDMGKEKWNALGMPYTLECNSLQQKDIINMQAYLDTNIA